MLPVFPPAGGDTLEGVFRCRLIGLALYHRINAMGQQLACLTMSLSGQRQRHIGIPTEGHELGLVAVPVCPALNFSTRRRDPKEQFVAIADFVRDCYPVLPV